MIIAKSMRHKKLIIIGATLATYAVWMWPARANSLEGSIKAQPPSQLPRTVVADMSPTIINQGAAPRTLLEMTPNVGVTQTIKLNQDATQTYSNSATTQSFHTPPITLQATLRVTDTSENSTVDVRVDSASSSYSGLDPAMADQANSLVSGIGGSSMQIRVDHSGKIIGDEPVLAQGDGSEIIVLGNIDRNFLSLADPLPSVALGVGATWSVTSSPASGTLTGSVMRTYTITSISQDSVTADLTRQLVFNGGVGDQRSLLYGSSLSQSGTATWPLHGVVGVASYSGKGSFRYQVANSLLHQDFTQTVTSQILSLTGVTPPTTTAPPTTTTTQADIFSQTAPELP